MEHRRLGRSGLHVSEITFGNWLTHGESVAAAAAVACVQAALDAGITPFDTADIYAQGAAEELLGKALHGVRRESVELATKVCLPTGDGPNDSGLSRKHILESCHASLRRLGTAAAGIRLDADLLTRIDTLLGDLVERDPAKTAQMMAVKPDWAQRD